MKQSVKEFCRINGVTGVTADMLYDAYIRSDDANDSRNKIQLNDTGCEEQTAISARVERAL